MEKFQYGQQVTYQVEEVIQDFKTAKTHVKYVRTKYHGDMLLMDDEIQFSTLDEHRYHELLVPKHYIYGPRVLILGGGDGLALRNLYRNSSRITHAVVVDWDQEFVEKFAMNYERNNGSLKDSRTIMVYMDALEFLQKVNETFDTIVIDLPDPDGPHMQDLYFKILHSIPRVMKHGTGVSCHVGPVSLCKEHPNWAFITKVMKELDHYEDTDLRYCYVPSFSHEWGVVSFNYNVYQDLHKIDDIYEVLFNTYGETCDNDDDRPLPEEVARLLLHQW